MLLTYTKEESKFIQSLSEEQLDLLAQEGIPHLEELLRPFNDIYSVRGDVVVRAAAVKIAMFDAQKTMHLRRSSFNLAYRTLTTFLILRAKSYENRFHFEEQNFVSRGEFEILQQENSELKQENEMLRNRLNSLEARFDSFIENQ